MHKLDFGSKARPQRLGRFSIVYVLTSERTVQCRLELKSMEEIPRWLFGDFGIRYNADLTSLSKMDRQIDTKQMLAEWEVCSMISANSRLLICCPGFLVIALIQCTGKYEYGSCAFAGRSYVYCWFPRVTIEMPRLEPNAKSRLIL